MFRATFLFYLLACSCSPGQCEKYKKFSVCLHLLSPAFRRANHHVSRAQGNELGDSLSPSWEPFLSNENKKPSQMLALKPSSCTWAGVEITVGNPSLVFGDRRCIGTRVGLTKISWKLGSLWSRSYYTKLFPTPPCPSSYLQWGAPVDASGEGWNGFAMDALRHLATSQSSKQKIAQVSSDIWMLASLLHVILALTMQNICFLAAHIIGRSCNYNTHL